MLKCFNNSRSTLFLLLGLLATAPAFATEQKELSAAQIMKKVDERYTGDTRMSTSLLTLIDKKDRQRNRELKLFGLENKEVEKSIIYFLSPSDVKGTAYMSFDWKDESKEDDAWLYLPALSKVRRVASNDESGAFMGSDFSYADINGNDYQDYHYKMLTQSERVDGHDCWVIVSQPKDESIVDKTGYTESKSWVRKDIFMVIQSQIFVKKAGRIKYFSASDIEQIDGIWTAKALQMITTRNGQKEHASVLKFDKILYNQKVDENIFDTDAMQRGI